MGNKKGTQKQSNTLGGGTKKIPDADVKKILDTLEHCKHYSVLVHQFWYVIMIILTFIACAFVFPWLMGVIVHSLIGWSGKGNETAKFLFSIGSGDNYSLLPDFMGGMVGLFVGFIVEWSLVSKLRIISKYAAIKAPLKDCLNKIYYNAEKFKSFINSGDVLLCSNMFDSWFITNLVDDLDDYSTLCHLPHIIPRFRQNSTLTDNIHRLHIYIKIYEYNRIEAYNYCLMEQATTVENVNGIDGGKATENEAAERVDEKEDKKATGSKRKLIRTTTITTKELQQDLITNTLGAIVDKEAQKDEKDNEIKDAEGKTIYNNVSRKEKMLDCCNNIMACVCAIEPIF